MFSKETRERSQRRGRENVSLQYFKSLQIFLQRSIYAFRIFPPQQIRQLPRLGAWIFFVLFIKKLQRGAPGRKRGGVGEGIVFWTTEYKVLESGNWILLEKIKSITD